MPRHWAGLLTLPLEDHSNPVYQFHCYFYMTLPTNTNNHRHINDKQLDTVTKFPGDLFKRSSTSLNHTFWTSSTEHPALPLDIFTSTPSIQGIELSFILDHNYQQWVILSQCTHLTDQWTELCTSMLHCALPLYFTVKITQEIPVFMLSSQIIMSLDVKWLQQSQQWNKKLINTPHCKASQVIDIHLQINLLHLDLFNNRHRT